MNKYIVITTINPKSEGIRRFESFEDWKIVIVGDKKSPPIKSSRNLCFLSIEEQRNLGYKSFDLCPYNHYARKNLGYLYAIEQGAEIIYDTDDDNIPYLPYENWRMPDFVCERQYCSDHKFINAYNYFSKELIWPRGYPLDEIHSDAISYVRENRQVDIGIWQGLADFDPDVDALYRLIVNPKQKRVKFENRESIYIKKSQYCPFNSQNTLWNIKLFPLLYLPGTVSFRFTDILRGYLAQRCMWEIEMHLGFCGPTVYQKRNKHNLIDDFEKEIECYTKIKPIVNIVDKIELNDNLCESLIKIYSELIFSGYIQKFEIHVINAWIEDIKNLLF